LYVANASGWISEYPAGRSRPTRIIRKGLGEPAFCAIDSAGNLWVTEPYVFRYKRRSGPSLTEYKPGSRKPATIIMKGLSDPVGIAIDQLGNIYVAIASAHLAEMWWYTRPARRFRFGASQTA
jgi:sugar lactone lactonase YvrE